MRTVYLAGPINGCTDGEANDWRAEVKDKLAGVYEFLDPMRRDYRGREMDPGIAEEIVGNDMQDIHACDIILANCPKPSVGTSMEIFYAFNEPKKTVIVVVPSWTILPRKWWQKLLFLKPKRVPYRMSPWLKRFSHFQTTNLMSAITYLRSIA